MNSDNRLTIQTYGELSLENSSHEDLWDAHITIRDGSTWQIISLNRSRTEINAKHIAGSTLVGKVDAQGRRTATISYKDVKRLMK